MRPNWTLALAALVPALLLGTGCSGINATKSVSPLDFLIPGGFMRGLIYAPPGSLPAASPLDDPVPVTESGHPVTQLN